MKQYTNTLSINILLAGSSLTYTVIIASFWCRPPSITSLLCRGLLRHSPNKSLLWITFEVGSSKISGAVWCISRLFRRFAKCYVGSSQKFLYLLVETHITHTHTYKNTRILSRDVNWDSWIVSATSVLIFPPWDHIFYRK